MRRGDGSFVGHLFAWICTERIEREIESEDIHPRLTQETEIQLEETEQLDFDELTSRTLAKARARTASQLCPTLFALPFARRR